MLMASGETGYLTLLGSGLVPNVPRVSLDTWAETLDMCDQLLADPQGRTTIVLDALGGFERQCHQHVCTRDFRGVWGDHGFNSYQKGYEISVGEWLKLLAKLDAIRHAHGCTIMLLSHTIVRPFKNPLGDDFDRYIADCHQKTWGVTHKWADAVLFGTFYTVVETPTGGRGKGVGGTQRVLYTERRDAYDAKCRYKMPETITIPNDPARAWPAIWSAISGKTA